MGNAVERDPSLRAAIARSTEEMGPGRRAEVRVAGEGHGRGVYEAVVETLMQP